MSATDHPADDRLTVFCLHFLGGSGRGWRWVEEGLPASLRCVTIDLPGFGDAAGQPGYAVEEMAAFVMRAIRKARPGRWMLVGHSMGAKLAAVVARHAEDGAAGLDGLHGLVLLAGSPPGPEPMEDSQRRRMTGWFTGDAAARHAEAQGFIAENVGGDLHETRHALAVDDVLRVERSAWIAWLEGGSLEDWTDRVGVLRTPALIVAGERDAALGPDAQAALMAPHFLHHRLVTLHGAGHLLPLERSDEVARLIVEQARLAPAPGDPATIAAMGEAYWTLLHSDRVSAGTRQVLLARATPDTAGAEPSVLTAAQMQTLRAVMARVVPQPAGSTLDLAARIEAGLAAGTGDGWRHAELPPDLDAYRAGLQTLDDAARAAGGRSFATLDAAAQDGLLAAVVASEGPAGGAGPVPDRLDAAQMRAWFEDVRSEATRLYVAHPATLSRLGYSGIAYGGDGSPKSGFVRFGIGRREPWEPEPWHGGTPPDVRPEQAP